MKLLLLTLLTFLTFARSPASGAVVFSGIQDVPIPLNFTGVYLNPHTGVTTTTHPGDWNTAPWLNPFFGGTVIANDALLRSVITGADQVVNLAPGTFIDGSSNFAPGESGSSTHVGAAPDQFTLGVPGIIGFAFEPNVGGSTYYGWARVTLSNSGPGTLHSWAYDDTGAGILAGLVPEPGRALLLLLGSLGMILRRRR
jgi:hypothetical protein